MTRTNAITATADMRLYQQAPLDDDAEAVQGLLLTICAIAMHKVALVSPGLCICLQSC